MAQDMNGTLEAYRAGQDPPEGEPFEFEILDPEHEGYRPPYEGPVIVPRSAIDEVDGDEPGFKYDFPPEDERDRTAPVSYLPIERLGVRIQKDPG